MDELTMMKVEQMLQSNYQFLDFSSVETHETWYQMLKPYTNEDVVDGVRVYMQHESKTPTIADLIEYIQPFKEKRFAEARHNLDVLNASRVTCEKCNGRGYIWIVYPMYEGVMPCDCESGHSRFGEYVYNRKMEDPVQRLIDAFGGETEGEALARSKKYRKQTYYRGEKGRDVVVRYELKGAER